MCSTLATPWTIARQVPLSMGFSRKSTGVGCHFLLQNLVIKPCLFFRNLFLLCPFFHPSVKMSVLLQDWLSFSLCVVHLGNSCPFLHHTLSHYCLLVSEHAAEMQGPWKFLLQDSWGTQPYPGVFQILNIMITLCFQSLDSLSSTFKTLRFIYNKLYLRNFKIQPMKITCVTTYLFLNLQIEVIFRFCSFHLEEISQMLNLLAIFVSASVSYVLWNYSLGCDFALAFPLSLSLYSSCPSSEFPITYFLSLMIPDQSKICL